jgi:DNA-binding response OmpR family regulator
MERIRVLIIEDNRRMVGQLHDRFVKEGYETEVALNGAIGLTIVREREMDAAIVDHRVSGFEEWDLVRTLRKKVPRLPIVLINGPRRKGVSRVARQAGATRFMRAPSNLDRVVSVVSTVLDRDSVAA